MGPTVDGQEWRLLTDSLRDPRRCGAARGLSLTVKGVGNSCCQRGRRWRMLPRRRIIIHGGADRDRPLAPVPRAAGYIPRPRGLKCIIPRCLMPRMCRQQRAGNCACRGVPPRHRLLTAASSAPTLDVAATGRFSTSGRSGHMRGAVSGEPDHPSGRPTLVTAPPSHRTAAGAPRGLGRRPESRPGRTIRA